MTRARPAAEFGVFINYRREDSASAAGWLFDRLAGQIGRGRVYKDVDSIPVGTDFAAEIMAAIGASAVLLAVIGRQWLAGRRLDDPADLVRRELEEALARGVLVIPVLVDGAAMPPESALPTSLSWLARLQAVELRPTRFEADTDHLVQKLEPVLREAAGRRRWLSRHSRLTLVWISMVTVAVVALIIGLATLIPRHPGTHSSSSRGTSGTQPATSEGKPSASAAVVNGQTLLPTASGCSHPRHVSATNVALPGGLTATEFSIPQGSQPVELAADRHGNSWFTEFGTDNIGWISPARMFVECHIPTPAARPFAITAGPDGNMWFTEGDPDHPGASGNKIGKITPGGEITEYAIPTSDSAPVGIARGPDGSLWFTEYNASKIGRITVAGQISETGLPGGRQPDQIVVGPDGNLWFTEFGGNMIGRLTPGGALAEFKTHRAGNPVGIVSQGGTLWFAQMGYGQIGRMATDGNMLGWIPVPNREQPGPANLAVDHNGAVWFTEVQSGLVGHIANATPFKVDYEYDVTRNGSLLIDVSIGADGMPWFTVQGAGLIGKIT